MSPLKALWLILTIACEPSSRLASESFDRDLSLTERLAMRGHELVCRSCRRFHRQLVALREAIRRRSLASAGLPESLSAEARRRIIQSLNAAWNGGSPP
jgi:hypothetical protein